MHRGQSSGSIFRSEIPFGINMVFLQLGKPEQATKRFPLVLAKRTRILDVVHWGQVIKVVASSALRYVGLPLFSLFERAVLLVLLD